ncbi:MAG TPA: RNA methyltransferase [Roseiflexaceae bacterium]|nr:RNA methyltransferase [Roseiflexaceae bacterium]
MKRRTRPFYLAQTQPGFEAIAADEIRSRLEDVTLRGTRTVADKNGMVLFHYDGEPEDLMELRTIEDLFYVVCTIDQLPPSYAALRLIEEQAHSAGGLEAALRTARRLRPGRGGEGKLRYRVVARQVGRSAYRRVDAQRAVERAIAARSDHRWRLAEESALELWLTLFPGEALLAMRLSDEQMRHRSYKVEHLPASLRPTAAAALVWLTQPNDDDLFLDPMCGAGTILIERAHAGRYRMLVGGDSDLHALEVARANIGSRYKPIELHEWDARQLPLDAASVTSAAINLPFGRQIGTTDENRSLYPALLRECARVMQRHARLVLLSGDERNLTAAVRQSRHFQQRSTYNVQLLGRPARLLVLEHQ